MSVNETSYEVTTCVTSHMTLFGGGFFVQPNTVDFKFIFAKSDFSVSYQKKVFMTSKHIHSFLFILEQYPDLRDDSSINYWISHIPHLGKNCGYKVEVHPILQFNPTMLI